MKIRKEIEELKPYIPGKPVEEVKREMGIKTVIKLASNESPYPPFEQAIDVMKKQSVGVNRYPDSSGFYLKDEISKLYEVETENIVLGNGSNELMRVLSMVLLEKGDEVIAGNPSFIVYPIITKMMGAEFIGVPLQDYRLDLRSMKEKINEDTKIIFICNPNNPTGTIVTKEEVDEFLEDIPEDVAVVFDEAYFEYVDDKNYPDGLSYFNEDSNIIILRSFSKIYSLAGLRIGYGIMSKKLVEAVNKAREPFNVNSMAQAAAIASIKSQNEVKKRREMNLQNKRFVEKKLDEIGLSYVPTYTNFMLINVGKPCREVFKSLLQEGIIVRTGDVFGQEYQNYIRASIGTRNENIKFLNALEKITKG